MIWSIFTVYFNVSFAFLLLACDRQKEYMYAVLTGAGINLTLNFLLIPKYGLVGASIATVICEVAVLSLILFYAQRLVELPKLGYLMKVLSASGFMGTVIFFLPGNIFLKIGFGMVLYLGVMGSVKGINRDDIRLIRQMVTDFDQRRSHAG